MEEARTEEVDSKSKNDPRQQLMIGDDGKSLCFSLSFSLSKLRRRETLYMRIVLTVTGWNKLRDRFYKAVWLSRGDSFS